MVDVHAVVKMPVCDDVHIHMRHAHRFQILREQALRLVRPRLAAVNQHGCVSEANQIAIGAAKIDLMQLQHGQCLLRFRLFLRRGKGQQQCQQQKRRQQLFLHRRDLYASGRMRMRGVSSPPCPEGLSFIAS